MSWSITLLRAFFYFSVFITIFILHFTSWPYAFYQQKFQTLIGFFGREWSSSLWSVCQHHMKRAFRSLFSVLYRFLLLGCSFSHLPSRYAHPGCYLQRFLFSSFFLPRSWPGPLWLSTVFFFCVVNFNHLVHNCKVLVFKYFLHGLDISHLELFIYGHIVFPFIICMVSHPSCCALYPFIYGSRLLFMILWNVKRWPLHDHILSK